jgi:hypothetical protein
MDVLHDSSQLLLANYNMAIAGNACLMMTGYTIMVTQGQGTDND